MNTTIGRRCAVAAASAVVAMAVLSGCGGGSSSAAGGSASASGSGSASSDLELNTPGVLRVGVTPASQPYIFTDASGNWKGFEADLVNYAAKDAGIPEVEFVQQDFSTLLAAVGTDKYDIAAACIGVTDERRKTVDYVKDYNNGYLIFIANPDSGISSAETLAGKRIGVITGSVQESYVQNELPNASAVGFPDSNAAVQSLLSGGVDTVFVDTDAAGKYTGQYPQLAEVYKVESTAPCAWPISYDKPKLKAALDKAIEDAIADGTVEKLTQQWLPDSPILPEYKPGS